MDHYQDESKWGCAGWVVAFLIVVALMVIFINYVISAFIWLSINFVQGG